MRLILAAFALTLIGSAALAEVQTVRIKVAGLWCPSCAYIAGQVMEDIETVVILGGEYVEDEAAVYTVQYDDDITSPEEIAQGPNDFGYPALVLEAETETDNS